MTKRALLIGCNYPGTDAALRGCVNDVLNMREVLINYKGFSERDIVMMIDTDKSYPQPTGANIRKALKRLASDAGPRDVIFMHYSGHGVEVPVEAGEKDQDGKDQCICPTDMNLITDDDFREFVNALPKGCTFTFVSDSCHSGGLIDHTKEQVGPNTHPVGAPGGRLGGLLGGQRGLPGFGGRDEEEEEDTREVKSRSLPIETLMSILSQQSGKPVEQGNIRNSISQLFGDDASPSIKNFAALIGQHGGKLMQQLQSGDTSGLMSTFGKIAIGLMSDGKHGGDDNEGSSSSYSAPSQSSSGGAKPSGQGNMLSGHENAALISGCQSNETSADVNPDPSDPSSAHGALTASLLEVMKTSGPDINNKELVLAAREQLKKGKFTQHPCLYTGDHMTDQPFVAPSES